MRKALVLGSVTAVVCGLAMAATPASADTGTTLITFTAGLAGTTVSISPGVYVPGTGSTNTVAGSVVSVVTDLRTGSAGWSDSVSSTDFSLAGVASPPASAVISAASAKIWSPTTVVTIPGTATITNAHPDLANALILANTGAQLLSAATANVNVTTITSNLQIDTTGKASGLYTGTLTQTVS